jgi:hypothetical protein
MKTLRKNWAKFVGAVALAGLVVCTVYACVSAWSQSAPVLSVAQTATNQVTITIVNGMTNGLYQIYYREFLTTNYEWTFFTNGTTGQTTFTANMGDTVSGFFEAAYNTNFVPPSITVIILSPTNGALIY